MWEVHRRAAYVEAVVLTTCKAFSVQYFPYCAAKVGKINDMAMLFLLKNTREYDLIHSLCNIMKIKIS